jgi:hypothetical protein
MFMLMYNNNMSLIIYFKSMLDYIYSFIDYSAPYDDWEWPSEEPFIKQQPTKNTETIPNIKVVPNKCITQLNFENSSIYKRRNLY